MRDINWLFGERPRIHEIRKPQPANDNLPQMVPVLGGIVASQRLDTMVVKLDQITGMNQMPLGVVLVDEEVGAEALVVVVLDPSPAAPRWLYPLARVEADRRRRTWVPPFLTR